MSKLEKLKNKIKKVIKSEEIFVPYNIDDTTEVKIDKIFYWCESTYKFIIEELDEQGMDFESFEDEFAWYSFENLHKDDNWYLKKLYYSIVVLNEEIFPRWERIKKIEEKV